MDWKLTATTLFCDTMKKWVPIIVYKDGRTNCGYHYRHKVVSKENPSGFLCHGPLGCVLCEAYKEEIFSRMGSSFKDS